jgi:hypothetical protein
LAIIVSSDCHQTAYGGPSAGRIPLRKIGTAPSSSRRRKEEEGADKKIGRRLGRLHYTFERYEQELPGIA